MHMVRISNPVILISAGLLCRNPPVLFDELLGTVELPFDVRNAANTMLGLKTGADEKELLPAIPELQKFIADELERIPRVIAEIQDDRNPEWEPLNEFFRELVLMW